MITISLNMPMALGNGNRHPGEVLATINGVTPNEVVAGAHELVGGDLEQLPGTITPAAGVIAGEVLTALRNPRLCEFTIVAAEEPDATDGAPEPEPRPKRPEPRPKKK